jgi:hypothetical protein
VARGVSSGMMEKSAHESIRKLIYVPVPQAFSPAAGGCIWEKLVEERFQMADSDDWERNSDERER